MYGQTYADMMITPPRTAWQMLRALRHAPPGRADRGARKAVFDAALEQAEQFFAAAQSAGTATRPVQLFYGLAQAGRALAAAASTADNNHWRLPGGHGLTAGPLQDTQRGPLAELSLKDGGRGSFTHLATLLAAASLPEPTPLGQAWGLLPEAHRFPLPGMSAARSLVVEPESSSLIRSGRARVRVSGVPADLAHRVDAGEDASQGQEQGWENERRRIAAHLEQYPGLSGWEFTSPPGNPVGARFAARDELQVPLLLGEVTAPSSEDTQITARTTGYRARRHAFPRIGGAATPAHPFLLWWAVMYALSMLSRYEPQGWAERTLISASPDAAPIEYLLEQALVVLPEVIHRTVLEVADDNPSAPSTEHQSLH